MRCISVNREGDRWRALVEWDTGFWWWRKTHRGEVFSFEGTVWMWPSMNWFDSMRCRPNPEFVVDVLIRTGAKAWLGEKVFGGTE